MREGRKLPPQPFEPLEVELGERHPFAVGHLRHDAAPGVDDHGLAVGGTPAAVVAHQSANAAFEHGSTIRLAVANAI